MTPAPSAFGRPETVTIDPAVRFDLTAAVLRGFASSVVDCIEPDGTYLQARTNGTGSEILSVRRVEPTALRVRVTGRDVEDRDIVAVRNAFGIDRRPLHFEAVVEQIPWFAGFARAARGLRPSQYATVWEAVANAIFFQSVSLASASAVLRRAIVALSEPALSEPALAGSRTLYPFPSARAVAATTEAVLLQCGLSRAKAATLVRIARAVEDGELDADALGRLPTPQLEARLTALPGIGPWTASVVALRAFGRLDTFPPNDSGISRDLAAAGAGSSHLDAALRELGDERGMLYHYVHLERIVRAGDAVV